MVNKITRQDISSAPKEKYILLFGDSGYTSTKLQACIGKYSLDREAWVDHAFDRCSDGGLVPTEWAEIVD